MRLFLVTCLLSLVWAHPDSSSHTHKHTGEHHQVIVLTDGNFEHDTQAATGATTGHWLVDFYAPWCGHCSTLNPIWDELSVQLKGQINVAKVDATANRQVAQRFQIEAYPTIKYFRQGRVYDYNGHRTVEDLKNFVLEDYAKADSVPVPRPPTQTEMLAQKLGETANDVKILIQRHTTTSGIILALGLMVGVLLTVCVVTYLGNGSSPLSPRPSNRNSKKAK